MNFLSLSLMLVVVFLGSLSFAANLSATFFSENNFSASSKKLEVFGEVQINEKVNSSSLEVDPLTPVGRSNISSVIVEDGYCVILNSEDFFQGEELLLGSGSYSDLEDFDNKTKSFLVYKMRRLGQVSCNPEADIPYVYGEKMNKFPLTFVDGYLENNVFISLMEPIFDRVFVYFSSALESNRIHLPGGAIRAGGIVNLPERISVPKCYRVKLISYDSNFSLGNRVEKYYENVKDILLTNDLKGRLRDAEVYLDYVCIESEVSKGESSSSSSSSSSASQSQCKKHQFSEASFGPVDATNTNSESYKRTRTQATESCGSLGYLSKYSNDNSSVSFVCNKDFEYDRCLEEEKAEADLDLDLSY